MRVFLLNVPSFLAFKELVPLKLSDTYFHLISKFKISRVLSPTNRHPVTTSNIQKIQKTKGKVDRCMIKYITNNQTKEKTRASTKRRKGGRGPSHGASGEET